MANSLTFASTITSKGQTTIPKAVRDVLGLAANDQIVFQIGAEGVSVSKVELEAEDDPVMLAFLDFLARDILENPDNLAPVTDVLLKLDTDSDVVESVDLDEDFVGEAAI